MYYEHPNMNPLVLNPDKLYYSIGEVSKMFNISKSLIRYWETEFEILKPHKNGKGERRFTKKNIDQLNLIFHLVKERGFTLKGAKTEIYSNKDKLQKKQLAIGKLREIKSFLKEIENKL